MPKLKPQSMAYDAARDVTYLYATCGKDRYLLRVDDKVKLELVRKLPALSETFWVADGIALFWKMETTVIVPLAADAKTKSLKGAMDHRAISSSTDLYGVTDDDHRVLRFDGAGWTEPDASTPDGYVLRAELGGAFQRTLRPGQWSKIVDVPNNSSVHTTTAISGDRKRWLIASRGGTHLCEVGKTKPTKTAAGWGWCAIGFGDAFYTSRDHEVWQIDLDGKETATGVGADDPPDSALFACGKRAFYLTGDHTIYRLQKTGDWSKHDIAKAGAAIGIGS